MDVVTRTNILRGNCSTPLHEPPNRTLDDTSGCLRANVCFQDCPEEGHQIPIHEWKRIGNTIVLHLAIYTIKQALTTMWAEAFEKEPLLDDICENNLFTLPSQLKFLKGDAVLTGRRVSELAIWIQGQLNMNMVLFEIRSDSYSTLTYQSSKIN